MEVVHGAEGKLKSKAVGVDRQRREGRAWPVGARVCMQDPFMEKERSRSRSSLMIWLSFSYLLWSMFFYLFC